MEIVSGCIDELYLSEVLSGNLVADVESELDPLQVKVPPKLCNGPPCDGHEIADGIIFAQPFFSEKKPDTLSMKEIANCAPKCHQLCKNLQEVYVCLPGAERLDKPWWGSANGLCSMYLGTLVELGEYCSPSLTKLKYASVYTTTTSWPHALEMNRG